MDQGSQDRNLPASERKLSKAREDGQVSRSEDLSNLAVLGVGTAALLVLAPSLLERLRWTLAQQLHFNAQTVQQPRLMLERLQETSGIGVLVCLILAVLIVSATLGASVACGGWVHSLKPLQPDFSRLNPLTGFRRLFSRRKLITTGKIIVIGGALAAVAALYLHAGLPIVAALLRQPSSASVVQLSQWIVQGMGLMLLVVLLAAMVDVPLQTFLHRDEMKMSHQEAKQEGKESDGNPQIKGKIRQRQRELAQRNSVQSVPKADFVVMNPTHFAVAVRYDEKSMGAPQVISKGADLLAMKIRDLARHHQVPVLQAPMLARALYAHAELDQDIPAALYTAVAQVLVYIYRLRAAMRGQGPMPGDPPEPQVPAELDPLTKKGITL